MTKEELIREAEDYCTAKDEYEGELWSNDYEELPRAMADFAEKQIKKMLEGWTDERIKDWVLDGKDPNESDSVDYGGIHALENFRDELLKQLEG